MAKEKIYGCGFELTIELIGGKWKGLILWYIHEHGTLRNGEMLRLIPSITQKMLTQQLREMEESGLVSRKVYEQVPPKVEYTLTEQGERLKSVLVAMKEWGIEYAKEKNIKLFKSVACIGNSVCNLGVLDTPKLINDIFEHFSSKESLANFLPTLRISGCPNSCGTHQIGELGLWGKKKGGESYFTFVARGDFSSETVTLNKPIGELIQNKIPFFLEELAETLREENIQFNEFIKLSKDKQKEYIGFLEKLPHYYVYKNNLIVHANIKHDNIFNLTRQSAIYGTDDALSDIVYSKLKNEYSINKYQLVRGHIPLLDEENIHVKNLLTECNKQSIACKKTKYDNNDTEGVISLEEKAVNKGYLCMYNAYSDKMVRQKTNFDYTRDLEVYNGKKLIEDFEKLTKYSLPVYNKNNEITGEKETPLISYKNNPTGTLRIYKYDKKVFFKNLWHLDPLLVKSRGLVLDTNGNIVQHPFTKVFNFNENGSGLDIPNDKEVIAATKENGFLGCITKWNNELLITTTGSFDSDFTNYIKDFITNKQFEHFDHKLYGNLFKFLSNNDLTLMFEVIHPNDPHIIKYEKEEMGLRLIGARGKNINDKELPEEKLDEIGKLINVKRPEWFKIEYGELKDLVKSSQLEGYMVRDIDTQETLLKFKTPYYLTTKFIGRMSIANINFMYSEGVDIGWAELDSNGYLVADDTVSGNIMNMTLPGVEKGTYSVTINYSSDDNNSDTYFEICNLADDSVIAKASATAYNETTIDNIEVNDTSDLIIKCFKKDGYSLILKNVHINRK